MLGKIFLVGKLKKILKMAMSFGLAILLLKIYSKQIIKNTFDKLYSRGFNMVHFILMKSRKKI